MLMFYTNARIFGGDFQFHMGAFEVVDGKFGAVLPENVPADAIKIRIEFILENEAGERRALFVDKDIPVPASGAPEEWASGKFITYPVLLAADSDLKFATPTVEPWYPSQAGGTIVIK